MGWHLEERNSAEGGQNAVAAAGASVEDQRCRAALVVERRAFVRDAAALLGGLPFAEALQHASQMEERHLGLGSVAARCVEAK